MDFPRNLFEFGQMFNNEDACLDYMIASRWPEGFLCPMCDHGKAYLVRERKALKCAACGHWTYITEGTVMEKSGTPLCAWFMGAYLMTTLTPGVSALQFQRQVGLSRYETAFQMLHKLRAAMVRPQREKLSGVIEVDETIVGGHRIGGKPGRAHEDKALVVGAVEVVKTYIKEPNGKRKLVTAAGRARLKQIPEASKNELHEFVVANVEEESEVHTDGWRGYTGLHERGYDHVVHEMGDDPAGVTEKVFPHVHRVFGNLKAWIIGTHHGVSPKHIQAYLNEYVFRFNRRKNPMLAFNTILGLAAESEAPTYKELYLAGEKGGWVHPNPMQEE